MIHSIHQMIGRADTQARLPSGVWARAVPIPFVGGIIDRARDAWAILIADAFAVRWPRLGELEVALDWCPESEIEAKGKGVSPEER